jgi:S-ribosylhomocysteine lyase
MHSLEHMFATYVRNSDKSDKIIYFGPMGCQTGFYLLVRDMDKNDVLVLIKDVLKKIIDHKGEIFGNKREECGNYRNLNLETAQMEAQRYLNVLNGSEVTFKYE